jgi:polyisoprenoid-binding protein YceI
VERPHYCSFHAGAGTGISFLCSLGRAMGVALGWERGEEWRLRQQGGSMIRQYSILFAALAFAVSACNNNPAKSKAQATVGAASAETQLNAATGATTYSFSNDGSQLGFVGAKVTKTHDGSFGAFRGNVQLVDGDPTKSQVKVEIDTGSLAIEPAKLASHLKTADFFDVEKFPKATFTSTSIRPGGDKGATHTVSGNLELHGVTKSITFPATIRTGADAVDVDAEFAINRKDFGIVYPGMPDDLIKEDVLIKLKLHAKKG